MGFNIKPRIERFTPHNLESGTHGIMDLRTGELLRRDDSLHRIRTFAFKSWAQHECDQLNLKEDSV
jgi:hypothetical protein